MDPITILQIVKGLISLTSQITSALHDNQLLDAGQKAELASSLAELQRRAGIAKEVEAETAKMDAAQVADDLDTHGELRD